MKDYELRLHGVYHRSSGRVILPQFPDWADYQRWVRAGGVPDPMPPPPPPPPPPPLTQNELDAETARLYPKLASLRAMTPAQVATWVDANITDLAAARDAIKTLAIAVGILARKL